MQHKNKKTKPKTKTTKKTTKPKTTPKPKTKTKTTKTKPTKTTPKKTQPTKKTKKTPKPKNQTKNQTTPKPQPKKTKIKIKKPKPTPPSKKPLPPATLNDILGIPNPIPGKKTHTRPTKPRIKPQWKKYHQTLLQIQDQLHRQMKNLAQESTEQIQNYSLHMADAGTDNFNRDIALSLLTADQETIYDIQEAIHRIETGTYGTCQLTGKPIPKARLEAIPWARYTVKAQEQLEKQGAIRNNRQLGALGTIDHTGNPNDPTDTDPDNPDN